jgi:hypothetical protein
VGVSFARYITTGQGASDEAYVAKWGVQVSDSQGNTFASQYKNGDEVIVSTDGTYKVVAPGTSGTVMTCKLTGTPEVLTKVSCDLNFEFTNWNVGENGKFYCPLIFTVATDGDNSTVVYGSEYSTADDLNTALKSALASSGYAYYAPTTNLSTIDAPAPTITWEWALDGGQPEENSGQTNDLDTALGNAAANTDDASKPTISFIGTVTAEQVQSSASSSSSSTASSSSSAAASTD